MNCSGALPPECLVRLLRLGNTCDTTYFKSKALQICSVGDGHHIAPGDSWISVSRGVGPSEHLPIKTDTGKHCEAYVSLDTVSNICMQKTKHAITTRSFMIWVARTSRGANAAAMSSSAYGWKPRRSVRMRSNLALIKSSVWATARMLLRSWLIRPVLK